MSATPYQLDPTLDLGIERLVDLTPEQLWAAWTTPALLVQWFCPAPWTVSAATLDLRPGGGFTTVMRSPEGQEHPHTGTFLEIVPNRRLVWTDALLPGYRPGPTPFITAVITFEPRGNNTQYTAVALHRDAAAREQHEQMGFIKGWNTALDQLIALMKRG